MQSMVSKPLMILLLVVAAMDAQASVPIEVVYGRGRNKTAMKLWQDAETQLKNGDVANAHRNVEAALRSDPQLYPALYTRAKVFIRQRKYELAVQDCTNALRQDTHLSKPPYCAPARTRSSEGTTRVSRKLSIVFPSDLASTLWPGHLLSGRGCARPARTRHFEMAGRQLRTRRRRASYWSGKTKTPSTPLPRPTPNRGIWIPRSVTNSKLWA